MVRLSPAFDKSATPDMLAAARCHDFRSQPPAACQNPYRTPDLGSYPRRSCSSAPSISSWSGYSAGSCYPSLTTFPIGATGSRQAVSGKVVATGQVAVSIAGERPGVPWQAPEPERRGN